MTFSRPTSAHSTYSCHDGIAQCIYYPTVHLMFDALVYLNMDDTYFAQLLNSYITSYSIYNFLWNTAATNHKNVERNTSLIVCPTFSSVNHVLFSCNCQALSNWARSKSSDNMVPTLLPERTKQCPLLRLPWAGCPGMAGTISAQTSDWCTRCFLFNPH